MTGMAAIAGSSHDEHAAEVGMGLEIVLHNSGDAIGRTEFKMT